MKVLLLLLLCLLSTINAMSIKTSDTKEYCFTVKGKPGQYLHFSYIVRGRNEDNVALKVNYCHFKNFSSIMRTRETTTRRRKNWT